MFHRGNLIYNGFALREGCAFVAKDNEFGSVILNRIIEKKGKVCFQVIFMVN